MPTPDCDTLPLLELLARAHNELHDFNEEPGFTREAGLLLADIRDAFPQSLRELLTAPDSPDGMPGAPGKPGTAVPSPVNARTTPTGFEYFGERVVFEWRWWFRPVSAETFVHAPGANRDMLALLAEPRAAVEYYERALGQRVAAAQRALADAQAFVAQLATNPFDAKAWLAHHD